MEKQKNVKSTSISDFIKNLKEEKNELKEIVENRKSDYNDGYADAILNIMEKLDNLNDTNPKEKKSNVNNELIYSLSDVLSLMEKARTHRSLNIDNFNYLKDNVLILEHDLLKLIKNN